MSGDSVIVAVRVRSFVPRELEAGAVCNVAMKDSTVRLTDATGKYQLYTLDHTFWSHADGRCVDGPAFSHQADVYSTIGVQLVDNAWAGYNSSILAYGQTGSGKTYSIFGPSDAPVTSEHRGLIPRVFQDLFQRIQHAYDTHGIVYKIEVSMIELYLEIAYDLLVHGKKVCKIHGTNERGFYTPTVTTIEVKNYSEVEKVLAFGNAKKVIAVTNMNDQSSRAHTLFDIHLRRVSEYDRTGARVRPDQGPVYAKLSLVDLAGSENVKLSGVQGVGVRQASNVNKSLLVLGNCIEACVERGRGRDIMIPFRDSALTQLLKECIGGNSKTIILCTISPSFSDASQSKSTLFFANRAKQIKCHARMNEAPAEMAGPPPIVAPPPKAELLEIERLRGVLAEQTTALEETRAALEAEIAAHEDERAARESAESTVEALRRELAATVAERDHLKRTVGEVEEEYREYKEEMAREVKHVEEIWSAQYKSVKQRAEDAEGAVRRLRERMMESAKGLESQAAALQEQDATKRNMMAKAVALLSAAKRYNDDERRRLVEGELDLDLDGGEIGASIISACE